MAGTGYVGVALHEVGAPNQLAAIELAESLGVPHVRLTTGGVGPDAMGILAAAVRTRRIGLGTAMIPVQVHMTRGADAALVGSQGEVAQRAEGLPAQVVRLGGGDRRLPVQRPQRGVVGARRRLGVAVRGSPVPPAPAAEQPQPVRPPPSAVPTTLPLVRRGPGTHEKADVLGPRFVG